MKKDKSIQIGFRCLPSELKTIDKLAKDSGKPRTETIRSFFPPNLNWEDVLMDSPLRTETMNENDDNGRGNFIYWLAAYGLRYLMISDGIDPYEFEEYTPAEIPGKYLEYLEAIRDQTRTLNHDGSKPQYRFETPPSGGTWERRGVTGKLILHYNERLTPDGFEHYIDEDKCVKA